MKILADTDNYLYLITDMLADQSISIYINVYRLFESLIKKKVSSLKCTSQTLQHKQPSLNSVSLKIYFTLPLPSFAIKSHIDKIKNQIMQTSHWT